MKASCQEDMWSFIRTTKRLTGRSRRDLNSTISVRSCRLPEQGNPICWHAISRLLPSPKGFEGNTSFLATGFLSDIRLRIEEILAELEPWQIMYERLIEFRREENDWPSVTEGKLGLWCNTQRIAYKRGKLQEERHRQLESIGFEWNQLDSKWMKEFRALKFFLDTCGR